MNNKHSGRNSSIIVQQPRSKGTAHDNVLKCTFQGKYTELLVGINEEGMYSGCPLSRPSKRITLKIVVNILNLNVKYVSMFL